MDRIPDINIEEYDYELPEERIAQFPVRERDKSKLLLYNKGIISEDIFINIHNYIPESSILIFNNTKVIRARLLFRKESGAQIEVFCLEPLNPSGYDTIFSSEGPVEWKCLVGNLKKWKSRILITEFNYKGSTHRLHAEKICPEGDAWRIRLSWDPGDITFGDVLESMGHIPLPPYVKREDTRADYVRYQTVYSKIDGSVAAPTAGLHFTKEVLENINNKGIGSAELTLHVGAGTFRPVRENEISRHIMHCEHFRVTKENIEKIIKRNSTVIAVGTTSVRSLESLYWLGVKAKNNPGIIDKEPVISQWDWTCNRKDTGLNESMETLLNILDKKNKDHLNCATNIMIIPGYKFRVINGIITNFHQPRSSLLLLIAAWTGDDWKNIYRYALANNFRFLSYGDATLML